MPPTPISLCVERMIAVRNIVGHPLFEKCTSTAHTSTFGSSPAQHTVVPTMGTPKEVPPNPNPVGKVPFRAPRTMAEEQLKSLLLLLDLGFRGLGLGGYGLGFWV